MLKGSVGKTARLLTIFIKSKYYEARQSTRRYLLTDSFSLYPAPLAKRVIDMTDAEIEQTTQRSLSQRRIMVSSMVFPEGFTFSLNGEGSEGEKYPIEDVSEMFLATLHQAYRVVNVPEAGLACRAPISSNGRKQQRVKT